MQLDCSPTLSDWSDSKLDELVANIKVPDSIKSLVSHKSMLYQFYDFYFNGVLPHDSSPHQLIYPFICLLKYDDRDERSYFIKDKHFAKTGFFKTAAPTVPSLFFTHAIAPYDIPARNRESRKIQNLYLSVTREEQKRFFTVIKHLIVNYSGNESSKNNKSILRVTGFLSLLLFRGISKDSTQLAREVNKKLTKDYIHKLTSWPLANGYSPPCKTCVEYCALDLNKRNSHSNSMMALILSHWKDAPAEQIQTKTLIQKVLLTHTAGNGLGLVTLMNEATDILGISIQKLMKYTLTEGSIESWQLLAEFICQFLHKQQPEKTYMWARLINDRYFKQFAARSHPYLAGMFAGVIDSQQTIGSIKQAAWFQSNKFQAECGYLWGTALVQLSRTKDISIPIEEEGVMTILNSALQFSRLRQKEERDPLAGLNLEEEKK